MFRKFSLLLTILVAIAPFARAADDITLADFEGKDYGEWKTTGDAFGTGPAQGTLPGQMAVTGFLGHGLANSFLGGDQSTGTLTSPPFVISRSHISFLIGGGGFAGKTCMNLLVNGKIVRTATGPNTKPGGSEALFPEAWDVSEFGSKTAVIEIVDQATGGWGHINVDQIVLTDRKPPVIVHDASRQIAIDKTYLHLPVKTGAPKRRMTVSIDGKVVREFEIELADGKPDFLATLEVGAWKGKTADVRVDQLSDDSAALKTIDQSDVADINPDIYREKLRPQFHFSPRIGWTNDPNGLVFYKGEYHLFFQHNPYGHDWGNMHWGHAVSHDLVHWEELPVALYPKKFGDWVFSGSAVVDKDNTAGFKTGADDPLVAAFTSTGRGECIAYSNDRGRTWSEFAGNPVVKHNGRDPRVLWHEPTKKWVMVVYDEGAGRAIAFYTSPDLKAWTFASKIEGFYECPDLFELPVDGNQQNKRWVLTAASSEYMIGQFDGTKFTPETGKLPGQRGNALYAAQTFSDIPSKDGRRIQIGWGRVDAPGMPFNQMMCFPCTLTLRTTPDGIRMCWNPVKEIEGLRGDISFCHRQTIGEGKPSHPVLPAGLADVSMSFDPGTATEVGLHLPNLDIRYDVKAQVLSCGGNKASLPPLDGQIRLRILCDRTSVEIFANDGLVYMPMTANLADEKTGVQAYARGGNATLISFSTNRLTSIWIPQPPDTIKP
ncbi:MAG TPA: glycoside hydrolase family 32 protein [Tepidisphaeraceae bacterium]|nr:glycoside hydrolase family 32 protein [Tepidisphaeraceae bacterium]